MSIGLVVFLFVIVIASIVVAGVLAVYLERNFPTEKFDERQQINRGNAYRFSHWIGIVYYIGLLAYFVLRTSKAEWPVEPYLLLAIGMLIQLQSFHVYCLMTYSALPLGEKPMPTIICYFVLGGMYLLMYFKQYIPLDAAEAAGIDGAMSFNLFRLLVSLDFFALAVMHLIAHLRKEVE